MYPVALYILLWFVSFCSPFVLAGDMCLLVYYIDAWFGSLWVLWKGWRKRGILLLMVAVGMSSSI